MTIPITHFGNDVASSVGTSAFTYLTFMAGDVAKFPLDRLYPSGFSSMPASFLCGFLVLWLSYRWRSGKQITHLCPNVDLSSSWLLRLQGFAARLDLPVSTAQCLTGATTAVAFIRHDLRAVIWERRV